MRKDNGIVETKACLAVFHKWAAERMDIGDLFLSCGLMGIKEPENFIKHFVERLERDVHLRRPNRIERVVVLVKKEGYPHLHILMKDCDYRNERKGFSDFKHLVTTRLARFEKRKGQMDVTRITSNVEKVTSYAFQGQGNVEVLLNATYLGEPKTK